MNGMEMSVKETLHKIIDSATEEQLYDIYNWINEGMPGKHAYSEEDLNRFYTRLTAHENGTSKSYSIAEAVSMIRKRSL